MEVRLLSLHLTPTMDLEPKEDTNSKPAPNSNDVRLVAQN